MKNWFLSLEGAVTLSVICLLTFLARATFLDAMFVLPNEMGVREDQPVMVALLMLWTIVFFGGWIWALLAAARGGRGGLTVALIFSLVVGFAGGLYTLFGLCLPSCAAWPVGNLIVWAAVVFGLAASVALSLQLWRGPARLTT